MATLILLLAMLASAQSIAAQDNRNVVYQDDHVRISLVSDGVARLEYEQNGHFVDNASFVAVNRNYPQVDAKVRSTGRRVTIRTRRMTIEYTKTAGPFTDKNLTISSPTPRGAGAFVWHPGQKDSQNLKGTYRTLDGYDGDIRDGKLMPLEDGLLSRSGWTLIDDSQSYLFDNSDWPWVTERQQSADAQDFYFMAYGHDYKQALRDYTLFAGQVPLPPRFVFGYWWSRYWHYSDNDFRQLVRRFHDYDIPLDVLVIDMDWHYINDNLGGWTGYNWNQRLFPDAEGFIRWTNEQGLKTTLNLHPADGVRTWEQRWPLMAEAMGIDTTKRVNIPWQGSNKRFMTAWYDIMLRPMERWGVDFWWLDWQQRPTDERLERLSNTWWLNYTTFTDMARHSNRRPLLYHRWGGLGNHRYQIGFSGDAVISWKSLDFQPYFNSTASNVLYSYWSHDIGGHWGPDSINPELYVRWMQFGTYSPVLRTHSTKNAHLNKEPWAFDYRISDILRATIHQRYRLVPYIYTMARKTYDEALPLCRPLYYDYPEDEEAYNRRNDYLFGDAMLISPVTQPMQDGRVEKETWLPSGTQWYETSSGTLYDGGQTIRHDYLLDEIPVFVKAGAIVPMYGDEVKNLSHSDEPVTLTVYPSSVPTTQTGTLYEDNGDDQNYATQYATTAFTAEHQPGSIVITIKPRKGYYEGMPEQRQLNLHLVCSVVPQEVTVNGQTVPFEYDGMTLSTVITLPTADCTTTRTVKVVFPSDVPVITDGLLGQMRRTRDVILKRKMADAGVVLDQQMGDLETAGRAITYHPEQFNERIARFRSAYYKQNQQASDKR